MGTIVAVSVLIIILSFAAQIAWADPTPANPVDHSDKAIALQRDMRQLWEEHLLWTRIVIISVAGGLPDLSAASDRLMQNQVDIGNAIKPYYGNAAGEKLTSLLKEHISVAGEILVAAKAGDATKTEDAKRRWYVNGDDIAMFLSGANPTNWPLSTMKSMMNTHLDTTLDEATARLHGDWKADIAAFDTARMHVLMMADGLSAGIIAQFPDKFADTPDDPPAASVEVKMAGGFQPQKLTVSAGTMVKWVNTGGAPHTVTADMGNAVSGGPDSSTKFPNGITAGESYTWTVPANAKSGAKWYYHCTYHGSEGNGSSLGTGMSGVIIVK